MEQVAVEPKKSSGVLKLVLIIGGVCVLLCSGMAAAIYSVATGAIKSAGFYAEAIARVTSDAEVKEMLGTPIEDGFLPRGEINAQGDGSGSAQMSIPLSGPKGRGIADVRATRSGGKWEIEHLVVRIEATGELIDVGAGN
jgi:hypothetical protein